MTVTAEQAMRLSGIALAVSPVLVALVAWGTGATRRELAGALAAGAAFALGNIGWDVTAFHAGWWQIPFAEAAHAPLWMYLPQGLIHGSALGLVGRRLVGRYGPRGLAIFLTCYAIFGVLHDWAGELATHEARLIEFGPGLVPWLGDAACWSSNAALAQLALRLVCGPRPRASNPHNSTRAVPCNPP